MKARTRKKIVSIHVCVSLFIAAFLLLSCENPMVQDLLRGPAYLDGISIAADDGNNYEVNPAFNAETTDYTITVPYTTQSIAINGRPHKDGTISYRRSTDGTSFSAPTSWGTFAFGDDVQMFVQVLVDRPFMDTRVYTLTIIRAGDSMLWGIMVKAKNTGSLLGGNRSLNPSFNSTVPAYDVWVPYNTDELLINGVTDTAKPEITVVYSQSTDGGSTWSIETALGDFSFLASFDSTLIKVKVEDSVLLISETYTLTIKRPRKVKIDPFAPIDLTFSVYGGTPVAGEYYFNEGFPVTFDVDPPFGYEITGINDISGTIEDGSSTPLSLSGTPPSRRRSFYMPPYDVTLTAVRTVIPFVPNVKYVRPDGTGDGSSWANASGNLQKIMDTLPAGYEIWVSAGEIAPDWSEIGTPSHPTSSTPWLDLTYAFIYKANTQYWSFVLSEGVKIYGGFAGTEKLITDKGSRDWKNNKTILTGSPTNSNHTLIAVGDGFLSRLSAETRLDGLTVTGGSAIFHLSPHDINNRALRSYTGGGMYLIYADIWLNNVTISGNIVHESGGGMCNLYSDPILTNVVIERNSAFGGGGGMYTGYSRPIMIGGSVQNNIERNGTGGILYSYGFGSAGFDTVVYDALPAVLINVNISGNISGNSTASVAYGNVGFPLSKLIVINTTITGNTEGIYNENSDKEIRVYNSLIRNNGSANAGGSGPFLVKRSIVQGLTVDGMDILNPDLSPINNGDNDWYPLVLPAGTRNSAHNDDVELEKVKDRIFSAPMEVRQAIIEALKKDSAGSGRINGTIDLGANEN
jgi:hypothetical protein